MIEKVLLVICDGLGDRPIKELGGKTPLEAAETPNLDQLAGESECGLMYTLGRGYVPGSDTAHLAIMGYERDKYYFGRGPIEVAGLGLKLHHGDVALRGNLGTVDDKMKIIDRRAGRIRDVSPFTKLLDGIEIDGVTFIVKPGTAHRAGVIMRGEGLSDAITDADPHKPDLPAKEVIPTAQTKEAARTADVLNKFLARAYNTLKDDPENRKRLEAGEPPANYLLVRGAGQYSTVPGFKERYGLSACCIAGGGLYKGVGAYLGMNVLDVPGATALPDTDIHAKFHLALENLKTHDFVFVHIKAADSLGEDGNFIGKRDFIAKIDRAAEAIADLPQTTLLIFTADHSTPCMQKSHSGDSVPIMFRGEGVRVDNVIQFGERACREGNLGIIEGKDVMPQVMNLFNRLPLIGA
jgi:2,3-bisphosphoglycerate-independent phosphoglycerate mutase